MVSWHGGKESVTDRSSRTRGKVAQGNDMEQSEVMVQGEMKMWEYQSNHISIGWYCIIMSNWMLTNSGMNS